MIKKGNVAAEMQEKKNSFICSMVEDKNERDVKIEALIREQYSMSMELALHRKKLMGILPDEEWNNYCTYVQECIEKASEEAS